MIFINFKLYQQTTGKHTLKLCKLIHKVNQKNNFSLITPCLAATDIYKIKSQLPDLEVYAQHADPIEFGKHTGFISPYALRAAGASGTILNHAEHTVNLGSLTTTINLCRKQKLTTLVGVDSLDQIKKLNSSKLDYYLFEDPKLIGGPVPMIEAHADQIAKAVKLAKHPIIVGGGIREKAHVVKSLSVNAIGVILASELAKSNNPRTTLQDLVSGFR